MTYRNSFLLTAENPLIDELDKACEELEKDTTVTKSNRLMAAKPSLKPSVKPMSNGVSDNATENFSSSYFLKREVERLKGELKQERDKNSIPELSLKDFSHEVKDISQSSPLRSFKARKTLKGKCKIMSFDWSPDHRHIVCGGQNGSAFVWDGFTGQKETTIHTSCEFVLTCSYSPSTTMIACSGFNRKCAVYSIDKTKSDVSVPTKEVGSHDDYITNCSFFGSDQQILTCGADSKVALWDIERQAPVQTYVGHSGTVTGLTINRTNPFSVFATCGMDGCVKVWDVRMGECVHRIDDIDGEVNQVRFFPTGNSLGYTTSEGKTYLYDLKSDKEVQVFYKPTILFGGSSMDFSLSGRLLFVGYEDATLRAWDTLKGNMESVWYDHDERISNVQMSRDHMALGTSSWDGSVKIWV